MQGLYFNTFDPNMSEKLHVLMAHFFLCELNSYVLYLHIMK